MEANPASGPPEAKPKNALRDFAIELVIYAVIVVAYFFLVLHFLGDWVTSIYKTHRTLYAFIALTLIVVQGVVLEMLTTALMKRIRRDQ
ncbi:MAG: hypothetical protein JWM16_4858 [Verrucomicrobiales bacterium]|nr:hypothetical protein [Verrucomicrobiales bacterium]